MVRGLRARLFRHLQTLPLGYFQRTKAGQTVSRLINDTDQVKTAVTAALASLLQNAVVIVVYVVILFGLSARLTLLALAFAPVLLFIVRPMISRLRRRSRELVAERGELTSHVSEMVASVKLIRAYVAEAFELERFKRLAERYRKRVLRAQRFSSLTSPVTEVFGGVMIVMILWVGTRLALGDPAALRPEMLITFLAVALRLMSPVKSVSNYPAVMAGAAASAERVFEVLDLPADEGDRPGETTAVFRERFEYRHVSFAYGEEAEVLRDVSLAVRRGQVVAIVRAVLRDPPILILDEATSQLDTESERLVQDAIDRLMRHRTVLVIAHRLATVQHADLIVVLEDGRLGQRGTHPELLAADGLYRRLYNLQFRT